MNYRREIDGLRAIAVLPVVFYHGGVELFSGGYAGVDVFFVISGYLITAIIISELSQGRFSLARFYERRARRILPALIAMVTISTVLALIWMPPSQLITYSKTVVSIALFSSNFFFWRNSGYFDPEAESNPLIHTWSLAVEEQFYILFPLALMLFWRFGRSRVFWLIAISAVASLLLTEYGWRYRAWANFYLLPTRAWELLAGSLCALVLLQRDLKPNSSLAFSGLGMIVVSILLFDRSTPFPSLWTLLPVAGTVLIILFEDGATLTGKLLGAKPLVAIGLISYSLYLWHQPMLAFTRIRLLDAPSELMLLGVALLSVPVAYLSWRYVEQPFRKTATASFGKTSTKTILTVSFAALLLVFATGLFGVLSEGMRFRFAPSLVAIDDSRRDVSPLRAACYVDNKDKNVKVGRLPRNDCTFPNESGGIDAILLGDSYADAVSWELIEELRERDIGVTTLAVATCVPFEGYWHHRARCDQSSREIIDFVLNSDIKTVVIVGRYSLYTDDGVFDNTVGGVETTPMGPKIFTNSVAHGEGIEAKLLNGLNMLGNGTNRFLEAGKNVVLVHPIPEAGWNVPDRYFKQLLHNPQDDELSIPYAAYLNRNGKIVEFFEKMSDPKLWQVRPQDTLCSAESGQCVNAVGSDVFYFDDDHLSGAGVRLIARDISDAVDQSLTASSQTPSGTKATEQTLH
ncbi:acyltransferase family protein [Labrenzia sp. VG12]|uniref:acyltransferase family protein n=1 Tax=Labrenzia sp. VG12 TaxID=2021862 RepID=UPI000B8C557C|nr:acyltransferase family protein [Labrenzia sp. VG12]ASP36098.1 acyltransferase [Labrenzia sp. VG12]